MCSHLLRNFSYNLLSFFLCFTLFLCFQYSSVPIYHEQRVFVFWQWMSLRHTQPFTLLNFLALFALFIYRCPVSAIICISLESALKSISLGAFLTCRPFSLEPLRFPAGFQRHNEILRLGRSLLPKLYFWISTLKQVSFSLDACTFSSFRL